ncbi:hypothetical protein [Hyphomicrobium sp.]|uniref:hypothetical protein n=1 Tax=Hyphomicrobium sp. TaxID=82 RepID=UPI003F71D1A4
MRALVVVATCIGVAASIVIPAQAEQPKLTQPKLTKEQAAAVAAYDKALAAFKKVLAERRAQIDALQAPAQKPAKKQAKVKALPSLPGQAIYLARLKVMSTYKDLTEVLPSRIGRPNKFSVPPAYFEAGIEPLIEDYADLFRIMQAPPAYAQSSETPLRDVVQLGTAIARAKGADAAAAERAGLIALGIFFAETNARQNIGNARSNTYKGSLQTGPTEDRNGRRKWAAIKQAVAKLDPAVAARDDAEEARAAGIDQRFNHWTAVRNGLMNAHADLFEDIPAIVAMLPDEIDQMKLFQLIQIVPTPTRAALKSGDVAAYEISDRRIMGFLRNNSIFTFGHADRARKSATYREILDAMWLFNAKFEKARARFAAIKHGAAE